MIYFFPLVLKIEINIYTYNLYVIVFNYLLNPGVILRLGLLDTIIWLLDVYIWTRIIISIADLW